MFEGNCGASRAVLAVALLAATIPLATATPAWAQELETNRPISDDEIVVTASRVDRAGFDAPTPTTVLGEEAIELRGAANVAEPLNTLPAFFPAQTPATGGVSSVAGIANFLNLRGLGPNRTLVLVNRRRHVPTTDQGVLDINLIPQALVERVDVVTGGASAAWGSDAVAGVVNFIFEPLIGTRADAHFGVSSRGDNQEYKFTLAHGFRFADDRGEIAIAGELFESKGVLDQTDRDWGRQDYQVVTNALATTANGQFRRLRAADVGQSGRSLGGLILTPGPLRNMEFNPDGTLRQFAIGRDLGSGFMIGGDGINQGANVSLSLPGERKTIYGTASYEVRPAVKLSIEGAYARTESRNELLQSFSTAPYVIQLDNPYLSAAVRNIAVANGIPRLQVGRINTDFGFITAAPVNETMRFVAALDGRFGEGWKWDFYYTYGENQRHELTENNLVVGRLVAAIDAVRDPTSGQIVCRSAAANPGCVPINILGIGSPSAAAIDYVTEDTLADTRINQHVAAASLTGEPFHTWAGPVSLALGAEYREESIVSVVDPISAANGFLILNPKALAGKFDVKEAFAEAVVPLLAEQPFAQALDLNGAVRITDYSGSGRVVTWKGGITYQVNESVRLRGTLSRDIRAANLAELFQSSRTSFAVLRDPRPGAPNVAPLVNTVTGGNPRLEPEKSTTWTAGIGLSPSVAPGLRASVDYYDIEVEGAIGALASQDILDRCFVGGQIDLCPLITIGAGNVITRIDASFINLQQLRVRGVDLELAYTKPLGGGDVSLRALASYVADLITNDGVVAIDRAGQAQGVGLPHWKATADMVYRRDALTVGIAGRYVGGGKYDVTFGPLDIDNNRVADRFYLDLLWQYSLFDRDRYGLQLFGSVKNLLDKDPPLVGSAFQAPFYTNPALYDTVGRFFTVGARLRF